MRNREQTDRKDQKNKKRKYQKPQVTFVEKRKIGLPVRGRTNEKK